MSATALCRDLANRGSVRITAIGPVDDSLLCIENSGTASLTEFVSTRRDELRDLFAETGALLLRGFIGDGAVSLRTAAADLCDELMYGYGDLPADAVDGTYRATPYRQDLDIHFHNEASHTARCPSKQFFMCEVPALDGGAWRLVSGKRALSSLPERVLSMSRSLGLRYRRRFVSGIDVGWKHFLGTDSPDTVPARAQALGYEYAWESAGKTLVLSRRAPAVIVDVRHGGLLWFNQILLHHPAALPERSRALLMAAFKSEDDFPRTASYGDGSAIDAAAIDAIMSCMNREAMTIPTRQHDVLFFDNLRYAHARLPYTGERVVRVAIGDPVEVAALAPPEWTAAR